MNQDKVNLYFVLFHFLGHPAWFAVGEDRLYYKHHSETKNWADASMWIFYISIEKTIIKYYEENEKIEVLLHIGPSILAEYPGWIS